MKTTITDAVVGEVTICCTRRSRRISLAVKPSLEVRLSYPVYVSQQRALEFLLSKRDWIIQARAKYAKRAAEGRTAAQITPQEQERLRAEAKATLPRRVEELAAMHGLRYGKVTIRAARSKWGSCTASGNISLSLYLMILPAHLRDYVILHELAHTIHHNHSKQFHSLVDRLTCGAEKQLAKELREYSIR